MNLLLGLVAPLEAENNLYLGHEVSSFPFLYGT